MRIGILPVQVLFSRKSSIERIIGALPPVDGVATEWGLWDGEGRDLGR